MKGRIMLAVLVLCGVPAAMAQIAPQPGAVESDAETDFWLVIRDSADPVILEKFLGRFPNGRYTADAREKLEALQESGDLVELPVSVNARREVASMTDCDNLAADPFDIANPNEVPTYDEYDIDPKLAVPACRGVYAKHPTDPRYQFLLGRAIYYKRDLRGWAEAHSFLEAAAAANYAAAARLLALMTIIETQNLPAGIETWRGLLTRAGEAGDPLALISLVSGEHDFYEGMRMPAGTQLQVAKSRTVELLQALADAGMPGALLTLADLTAPETGDPGFLPTHAETSCDYLERAMVAGSMAALSRMAKLILVQSCKVKNSAWLQRWHLAYVEKTLLLAEAGNSNMMFQAFYIYISNEFGDLDYPLAVSWLERAAAAGDPSPAYWLAMRVLLDGPRQFVDQHRAGEIMADTLMQGHLLSRSFLEGSRTLYKGKPPEQMPTFIRAIQERLSRAGYYFGPIDGNFGADTKWAVAAAYNTRPAPEDNL